MFRLFVLLFIYKLKFHKPINFYNYIRSKYGQDGIKNIRTKEKLTKKLKKIELDIDFLNKCKAYNVIPKFIKFKLYTNRLYHSKIYKGFLFKLLNDEILFKNRTLNNVNAALKIQLT